MAKKRHRGRRRRSNRWKYFNRVELTETYRLNDTLIKKYFPYAGRGFELGLGKDDGHHYWLKSEAEMIVQQEDFRRDFAKAVECLEGADVFTHWTISPEGEENTYQMRLEKAIKAGTAKYRMSVTVGDFTDSYEFTVNVVEAPADLPGGFGVAPQEYEVGDTMEFTIDDLTLLNEDGSA